jgi:CBS domain-containing protein
VIETKALGLVAVQTSLRADAPARDAARVLARVDTSGVLVVDGGGRLIGVLSDEDLLRQLLPEYIGEDDALARVLEEDSARALSARLEGRTVGDLLPSSRPVEPVVDGDATLVEVAAVMLRAGVRVVGVIHDDRLVGGIEMDRLLSHLLDRR